ncbi:uncharacterized protein LOC116426763 isoform X2 [Nomia melanderi]|nr:uncharacterized protein LOC116426763 isoform X2 [Nomia melanderi]
MGYTDFESINIEKPVLKNERKRYSFTGFVQYIKDSFKKLSILYSKIHQDGSVSKKQVQTILDAKVLLNDHACIIHESMDKYDCKPWRIILSKFLLSGAIFFSSIYIPFPSVYKNSIRMSGLSMILYDSYMEYLRWVVHKDLKTMISLQNDLFNTYKKSLKILKYGYKIKLQKDKGSQQFYDLTADRVKYLQPIMENVVTCLEHVSIIYYQISLILIKLLPINVPHEDLLTRFESASFKIRGEINYEKLQSLYFTYILVQSEMLHILAITYDNHTWQESGYKIPEFKLAYIINFLIKYLSLYKSKLSKVIDIYYSSKLEPISFKYRGPAACHWQNLYMHLYLSSNKLQLAYGHVLSVLQYIDNNVSENITSKDAVEMTMQELNQAQKNIETAKDFLEFGSIYLLKTQNNDSIQDRVEDNMLTPTTNADIRIVHDSEPLIMDEVFEEYIKTEYSKPLNEESDEISLFDRKRDKSLFKNFMVELKDVLVEKQKSMSERELKALQRMQKTMGETVSENMCSIPVPPPMPSLNASSTVENKQIIADQINKATFENKQTENGEDYFVEEKPQIPPIPLPRKQGFSIILPPPFLKADEETFIGDGENSEDEIVATESEE